MDNQLMSKYTFFNIPFSVGLTTLAYMLHWYEICLPTIYNQIFNIQDFRYIECESPFGTVLIRWHPHCVISNPMYNNDELNIMGQYLT